MLKCPGKFADPYQKQNRSTRIDNGMPNAFGNLHNHKPLQARLYIYIISKGQNIIMLSKGQNIIMLSKSQNIIMLRTLSCDQESMAHCSYNVEVSTAHTYLYQPHPMDNAHHPQEIFIQSVVPTVPIYDSPFEI